MPLSWLSAQGNTHYVANTPIYIIVTCAIIASLLLVVGAGFFLWKTCTKDTCKKADAEELKQPITANEDYMQHNYDEYGQPTKDTVGEDFLEFHARKQDEGTQKTYKCTMCRADVDRHALRCPSCRHPVKKVLEHDPIKRRVRIVKNKVGRVFVWFLLHIIGLDLFPRNMCYLCVITTIRAHYIPTTPVLCARRGKIIWLILFLQISELRPRTFTRNIITGSSF